MRKVVLFISVLICALTLDIGAQTGTLQTLVDDAGVTNDTLTDAGTATLFVKSTFSGKNLLSVQVVSDNISGTTAGTAIIQESVNGTDYLTIPDADTLTLSDGASIIWHVTDTPSRKYKVLFTGSGTQSSVVTGDYIYK